MMRETERSEVSDEMGNYVFCGSSVDDPRASSTGRRETEATPLGEMALVVHGRWKVGRKWVGVFKP